MDFGVVMPTANIPFHFRIKCSMSVSLRERLPIMWSLNTGGAQCPVSCMQIANYVWVCPTSTLKKTLNYSFNTWYHAVLQCSFTAAHLNINTGCANEAAVYLQAVSAAGADRFYDLLVESDTAPVSFTSVLCCLCCWVFIWTDTDALQIQHQPVSDTDLKVTADGLTFDWLGHFWTQIKQW